MVSKVCPQCGNSAQTDFCVLCGSRMAIMSVTCSNCGSELKEIQLFCSVCGKKVSSGPDAETAPVPAPEENHPPAVQSPVNESFDVRPPAVPKKNRSKKLFIGAGAAVLLLSAAALIYIFILLPGMKYDKAVKLFEDKQYQEAYDAILQLNGNYKNVAELVPYYEAYLAYGKKDYEEAARLFSGLGLYEDSSRMAKECRYQYASELLDSGAYYDAKSILTDIGSYKESDELVMECDYQQALSLLNRGEFTSARDLFSGLYGYKDASDQIDACTYQEAVSMLDSGDYSGAYEMFSSVSWYGDSSEQMKECVYRYAVVLLEDQEYDMAYDLLYSISGYKDSSELIYNLSEDTYLQAMEMIEYGMWSEALPILEGLGGYRDAEETVSAIMNFVYYGYTPPEDSNFLTQVRYNDLGIAEPSVVLSYVRYGSGWVPFDLYGYDVVFSSEDYFWLEANDGTGRSAGRYTYTPEWLAGLDGMTLASTPGGRDVVYNSYEVCVLKTHPGDHMYELVYFSEDLDYNLDYALTEIDRILDSLDSRAPLSYKPPTVGGMLLDDGYMYLNMTGIDVLHWDISEYAPVSVSPDYIDEYAYREAYGVYAPALTLCLDVDGQEMFVILKRYAGGIALLSAEDEPWGNSLESYHGFDIIYEDYGINGTVFMSYLADDLYIMVPLTVRNNDGIMLDNGSWDMAFDTMRMLLDRVIR